MHIPCQLYLDRAYKTASVDSAASVDDALAASDDASTSSNYVMLMLRMQQMGMVDRYSCFFSLSF